MQDSKPSMQYSWHKQDYLSVCIAVLAATSSDVGMGAISSLHRRAETRNNHGIRHVVFPISFVSTANACLLAAVSSQCKVCSHASLKLMTEP